MRFKTSNASRVDDRGKSFSRHWGCDRRKASVRQGLGVPRVHEPPPPTPTHTRVVFHPQILSSPVPSLRVDPELHCCFHYKGNSKQGKGKEKVVEIEQSINPVFSAKPAPSYQRLALNNLYKRSCYMLACNVAGICKYVTFERRHKCGGKIPDDGPSLLHLDYCIRCFHLWPRCWLVCRQLR